MKVTVERDAFSAAIDAVFRATRGAPDIPILKNVLISAARDSVRVTATNLSMLTKSDVAAEVEGDTAAVTVVGDALDRIVGLFPQGAQVQFQWDGEGQAVIACGRSRYKLHTLPAADFPVLQTQEVPVKFVIPAAQLIDALESTRFAIEKANGRFYLTGIYMHVGDSRHAAFGGSPKKRLLFVATNGGELARRAHDLPDGAEALDGIIIPEASVDEILRIAKQAGGDVELGVGKSLIEVRTGPTTFVSKLVDATYPDFRRPMPESHTHTMMIESKALLQAIARLSSLGNAKIASARLAANELRLAARSRDAGDAEEVVEIEFDGPNPIDFGIKLSGIKSCMEAAKADVCAFRVGHEHPMMLINPVRSGEIDYSATFLSMKLENQII